MKNTQLLSKLRSSNYNSIAYNRSYYNVYTQNAQRTTCRWILYFTDRHWFISLAQSQAFFSWFTFSAGCFSCTPSVMSFYISIRRVSWGRFWRHVIILSLPGHHCVGLLLASRPNVAILALVLNFWSWKSASVGVYQSEKWREITVRLFVRFFKLIGFLFSVRVDSTLWLPPLTKFEAEVAPSRKFRGKFETINTHNLQENYIQSCSAHAASWVEKVGRQAVAVFR